METQLDFDSWVAAYQPENTEYCAAYDPLSGSVFKIGNRLVLVKDPHIVPIDTELAEKIIEGLIPIHRCFVDLDTQKVEIAEINFITKINDILYRVSELKYTSMVEHDLKLVYNSTSNALSIQLTNAGHWPDEGVLTFYLTDYNDPNVVYKIISVLLPTIKESTVTYTDIELPTRFSIFTRSLFKHYVLEII